MNKKTKKASLDKILGLLVLIMFCGVGSFWIYENVQQKTKISYEMSERQSANIVYSIPTETTQEIIEGKVTFFNYDQTNGQKYIALEDSTVIVIPRGVKTPYINLGQSYTFKGVFVNHYDYELVASQVTE